MATFDQLSAEQRAIIELVVQRGRSYEALADVLQIDTSRVRDLAREALSELSPITSQRVDPEWRGQVADYLLGQQSGPESTATRGHLKRSEPARTWAMSLLDSLDDLYGNGSRPSIPDADVAAGGGRRRERGNGAAAVEERRPARERERDRERRPLRPQPVREKEEPERERRALSPEAQAAVRCRRVFGIGGGLVLVALVTVGILALAGVFDSGGGSSKKKGSSTTAAGQPKIIGQIKLSPVKKGVTASGAAFILQRGNQRVLVVQAKLPPLPSSQKTAAYEVWLFNSPTNATALGAQYTDAKGNYQGAGPLPANFNRYKFVDISREPFDNNTAHSGDSFLRGSFASLQPVQQTATPGVGTGPAPPAGAVPGGTNTTP